MPKRTDIESILVLGSGPIVIGQACEFDYSGTQAIKALKEEGYRVSLVNSNPATIMTDPEFADATYIEPLRVEFVEAIIQKERPDAILPTMGGQTALNLAIELEERGILARYGCELIGASVEAIKTAEDRDLFRKAMDEIGLESARSSLVRSVEEAQKVAEEVGFPLVLRPSRTLGGTGGGIARNSAELRRMVSRAIASSPNGEVLLEESLLGWKEIELEVMRDTLDNAVIICGIENLDPMGVHTGDSITVAPIQTLTDKEYQLLRDAALRVIRRIGVDTGGSNVQFAINPANGRVIIIEMNPRVSRSSALASKATGFPIAKIAAKLAVGYSLAEIQNDITKETPACFEPSIDYVVVKIPRFNFEKFPLADNTLGTQMRSVGEVLSFGRTFKEALQKALYSMEIGSFGFDRKELVANFGKGELLEQCARPSPDRLWFVAQALRAGHSIDAVHRASAIDPWFLMEIAEIVATEEELKEGELAQLDKEKLLQLKRAGFADRRIANLIGCKEEQIRELRHSLGVRPSYLAVDTCAAEFKAFTPYLYSSYEQDVEEAPATARRKVIILGSGPNRIGQGIEFDYCCTHASLALKRLGIEAIMVNCNPETVSTDYDISDRLFFEPLTLEHVLEIVEHERKSGELLGVIIQFGGQTPLKLAGALDKLGVPILGTSVDSIDIAEDRERFSGLVTELKLQQPQFATARSLEQGLAAAAKIGFPVMVRPSFVLGGRAMRVVYSNSEIETYFRDSVSVSEDRPVLVDKFLPNAVELDVDALCDGKTVVIAGVLEHIEPAGIHSGDSSCCLPPPSLSKEIVEKIKEQVRALALRLQVVGLINVQFAVTRSGEIFILEANPRASRTVPFISKATGIPWAQVAVEVMVGTAINQLSDKRAATFEQVDRESAALFAVKASVFPFSKFEGVDTLLGPEMKSTGEVMGLDSSFAGAFARAQAAAGNLLPTSGAAFLSVKDEDKEECLAIARELFGYGFELVATSGTAGFLREHGLKVATINKVREGSPHIVDRLGEGGIQLVINTPEGQDPVLDSRSIRLVANELKIPTYTTIAAASAAAKAIEIVRRSNLPQVRAIQEIVLADSESKFERKRISRVANKEALAV